MTHSIDLVRDRYVTGPVVIGPYAGVMSGCMLLAGTQVPARSIVSAGSVVTTKLTQELTLYRGNPAEAIRLLPRTLAYLNRGDRRAGLAETASGPQPNESSLPFPLRVEEINRVARRRRHRRLTGAGRAEAMRPSVGFSPDRPPGVAAPRGGAAGLRMGHPSDRAYRPQPDFGRHVTMGPETSIGSLNVIRYLEELRMDKRRDHRHPELHLGPSDGASWRSTPRAAVLPDHGGMGQDHRRSRDRLLRPG